MSYTYPIKNLYTGSSLGNLYTFVQLDSESNIHGIWSSVDNSYYLGNLSFGFLSGTEQVAPFNTVFEPSCQTTLFGSESLQITKRITLPFSDDLNADREELQKVLVDIEAKNLSDVRTNLRVVARFRFPAVASPFFTKRPPVEEIEKLYKVNHNSRSLTAREVVTNKKTVVKFSEAAASFVTDDKTAHVQFELSLRPQESSSLRMVLCVDPTSSENVAGGHGDSVETGCGSTFPSNLREMLSISDFLTPSGVINRGIYWAKVNTLRVQHMFKSGFGFTNDPPQDIVVVRDLAWYAMGCDYLNPAFSRKLFDLAEKYCFHANGKLTEFIHADETSPELHDYDLNINDDTPLFIIALKHHALISGDADFVMMAFRLAVRAADYILTQIRDGLVYCDAKGTDVTGIASWRNIIDDYNLTGYVTEINAECCASLRTLADWAKMIGENSLAQKYQAEAARLERNMLSKLRKDGNSLFYLNIDQDGVPHPDVTGDLLFPAMFGIGDGQLRLKIVDRLFAEDLWTKYGARTVASTSPTYDPQFGMNLMGGVWPNLSAWFAVAAKEFYPERVAEAMETIYFISESESPVELGNVIPGEFPERLHGDNFKSMGMGMSPWMPPTYLWLGIEGLVGLTVGENSVRVEPSLPHDWKFLCVFNVPLKGGRISMVIHDGVIYTDARIKSELPIRTGTFNHIVNSDELRVFKFIDKIGIKVFAFSFNGYKGKVSIPVNQHSLDVDLELGENEMKEVSVDEAD